MLSGVARFNTGTNHLGDWLKQAEEMVGDKAPAAVYATSDYGMAWFVKHPGEPWHYVTDAGDRGLAIHIRRDPLALAVIDKLIGSGDWFVLAPGLGS